MTVRLLVQDPTRGQYRSYIPPWWRNFLNDIPMPLAKASASDVVISRLAEWGGRPVGGTAFIEFYLDADATRFLLRWA